MNWSFSRARVRQVLCCHVCPNLVEATNDPQVSAGSCGCCFPSRPLLRRSGLSYRSWARARLGHWRLPVRLAVPQARVVVSPRHVQHAIFAACRKFQRFDHPKPCFASYASSLAVIAASSISSGEFFEQPTSSAARLMSPTYSASDGLSANSSCISLPR